MKYIIIGMLFILCQRGFSQQVINGFSMPESITSDGDRFFVSSQGQDFSSADGDGFISEIAADGKILHQKYLPLSGVLNAPKGMTIVNNILYVADLQRIVGFSIKNKAKVFELFLPEAVILNDICAMEDGFIAMTETVSGNIYKVNIKNETVVIIANIPTANGIAYNKNTKQLVVCTNGVNLGEGSVYLKTGNLDFKELPNMSQGFFDGIEWIDDDHLLISDWITFPVNGSGKIWIYYLKNQESEFSSTGESIADIFYNSKTAKIYMPQMLHNRVLITDWNQLSQHKKKFNNLYNYGVIEGFTGGLYRGTLPIKDLLLKGDFGIGAPDLLDGEMVVLDGRAYQTNSASETRMIENKHLTPVASVTFFKTDTTFVQTSENDKKSVLNSIEKRLPSKNNMYAIKISGLFDFVRTRAFPAVNNEPFPKLVSILDQQRFFEYKKIRGTLVGFYMPSYLTGINADGFHFHFLSEDKKQGGHLLDFRGSELRIEMATLKKMELQTPNNTEFQKFEFKKIKNESLDKVENGK